MEEIWKDIPGYKGLYQASNLGRIKSLPKQKKCLKSIFLTKERILKDTNNSGVYKKVVLCKESQKTFSVHVLVAMAFLNHIPNNHKKVVNHINLNKLDNNVNNLEIITNRANSNNKHLKSSSIYTGVCYRKDIKKWGSSIYAYKRHIHLGYFENEYDAHLAYQEKLKELTCNNNT